MHTRPFLVGYFIGMKYQNITKKINYLNHIKIQCAEKFYLSKQKKKSFHFLILEKILFLFLEKHLVVLQMHINKLITTAIMVLESYVIYAQRSK